MWLKIGLTTNRYSLKGLEYRSSVLEQFSLPEDVEKGTINPGADSYQLLMHYSVHLIVLVAPS